MSRSYVSYPTSRWSHILHTPRRFQSPQSSVALSPSRGGLWLSRRRRYGGGDDHGRRRAALFGRRPTTANDAITIIVSSSIRCHRVVNGNSGRTKYNTHCALSRCDLFLHQCHRTRSSLSFTRSQLAGCFGCWNTRNKL